MDSNRTADFQVDDVLRGPLGGEVIVMRVRDGEIFVHARYGWNTMSRRLRHPENYTRLGRLDRSDPLHVRLVEATGADDGQ